MEKNQSGFELVSKKLEVENCWLTPELDLVGACVDV
jgi:hypothetical protein